MSGNYAHVSLSTGTTLTASRYNGAHINHITNHVPEMMDDYSIDVAEMQAQADPGSIGSESLPSSLAGEVERVRYQIAAITGKTHWYEAPGNNTMNSGVSIDDDDNISGHGQKIDFRTADVTLSASENGKTLDCEKASDLTITVPDNAAVSLPVGYGLTLVQSGAGQVVIAPASGVTIRTAETLKIAAQWAGATLYKRAADEWVLVGDLEEA